MPVLVGEVRQQGPVPGVVPGVEARRPSAYRAGEAPVAGPGRLDHPRLVRRRVAGDDGVNRPHHRVGRRGEQLPAMERSAEADQVGGGGPHVTGAGDRGEAGVDVDGLAVLVARGHVRLAPGPAAGGRRRHAHRSEDPLVDELGVGPVGGPLQHRRGQQEAGPAVVEVRPRSVTSRREPHQRVELGPRWRGGDVQPRHVGPVAEAGGVAQQLVQRDVAQLGPQVGQPSAHRLVQPEPVLLAPPATRLPRGAAC